MNALHLVRILRRLPHTRSFDRHLTDCAALAVFYQPYGNAQPLTWRHVVRLDPLPPFYGDEPEIGRHNVIWLN